MNGLLAVDRNLAAYLAAAVPAQLAVLTATFPDVTFDNPPSVTTPAIPPGQIDKWPVIMVQPGSATRVTNLAPADDGGRWTYTKRYQPQLFVFARGQSYTATDAARNLLADAVWFALLADMTLGRPGEWELVPDSLIGPYPSTVAADKDNRSFAGARIGMAVDVFETAPLALPDARAPYGTADTINVEVERLPWDGRLEVH